MHGGRPYSGQMRSIQIVFRTFASPGPNSFSRSLGVLCSKRRNEHKITRPGLMHVWHRDNVPNAILNLTDNLYDNHPMERAKTHMEILRSTFMTLSNEHSGGNYNNFHHVLAGPTRFSNQLFVNARPQCPVMDGVLREE